MAPFISPKKEEPECSRSPEFGSLDLIMQPPLPSLFYCATPKPFFPSSFFCDMNYPLSPPARTGRPGLPNSLMIEINHPQIDAGFYLLISSRTCKSLSPGFPPTPTDRPISWDNALFQPECLNSRFHVLSCAHGGDVIFPHENAIIIELQAHRPPNNSSPLSVGKWYFGEEFACGSLK